MRLHQLFESDADAHDIYLKTGFWGKAGAGCIFMAKDTGRFLIARRGKHTLEPGTWGTWGGSINKGETPEQTIKREVREETGYRGELELKPLWVFKDPKSGFKYHNFLAIVPEEFDPILDWENEGYAWVKEPNWPRPRHFGFQALLKALGNKLSAK